MSTWIGAMTLAEKRKRRPTERATPEPRTPLPDYPGVWKLPGREVYAIKLKGMTQERIVHSWRTVARALERLEGHGKVTKDNRARGAKPKLVPVEPPSTPRRRVSTVPFDPTEESFLKIKKRKRKAPVFVEAAPLPPAPPSSPVPSACDSHGEIDVAVFDDDDLLEELAFDAIEEEAEPPHRPGNWTAEEDRALLMAAVSLGLVVGKRVKLAQWEVVVAAVSKIKQRSVEQVRRRWLALSPARQAASEAKRAQKKKEPKRRLDLDTAAILTTEFDLDETAQTTLPMMCMETSVSPPPSPMTTRVVDADALAKRCDSFSTDAFAYCFGNGRLMKSFKFKPHKKDAKAPNDDDAYPSDVDEARTHQQQPITDFLVQRKPRPSVELMSTEKLD
jgi:hypothetical protein